MKPSELIRQKGWCQGDAYSPRGGLCMYAALVDGHFDAKSKEFKALKKSINHESIVIWNDAPGRTAEEVIAKLEEFGL